MSNHPSRRHRSGQKRPRTRRGGPTGIDSGLHQAEVPYYGDGVVVVEHFEWAGPDPWDLSDTGALEIALDQRSFGLGQLVVACTDRDGNLIRINHTDQTDPPEEALAVCLDAPGLDAVAAIAYSDEPSGGPVTPDMEERFILARAVAALHRIHLVDWWLCDSDAMRSLKWSTSEPDQWWDVP